jgi:hypothetical protein
MRIWNTTFRAYPNNPSSLVIPSISSGGTLRQSRIPARRDGQRRVPIHRDSLRCVPFSESPLGDALRRSPSDRPVLEQSEGMTGEPRPCGRGWSRANSYSDRLLVQNVGHSPGRRVFYSAVGEVPHPYLTGLLVRMLPG